jgi:enterochelin esterase-like enzyme
MRWQRVRQFAALIGLTAAWCHAWSAQSPEVATPSHVFFQVKSAASNPAPLHGRLLIFIKQGSEDKAVDNDEMHPQDTWVAAREVADLTPGATVEVDADEIAFPQPFSAMPPGDYEAQAVLDVDHTYNYGGRDADDWISSVVTLAHWTPGSGAEPVLTLDQHPAANPRRAEALSKAAAEATPDVAQKEEVASPLLSAFWGHTVQFRAWVILPPGYATHPKEHYPTAYWTHGFGGELNYALVEGMMLNKRMAEGKMPPMFWVMLDESCPQGTHEFADSVNDGPWGAALTTEFIPYLEKKYRMDAWARGRLLNGHSSGGWASLQLETNYPRIFGGTWSTSPDPSDFHDFSGPDLYAPDANVYRKTDGSAWPIMRMDGKVLATLEQLSKLETVLGPYGGQLSSFEWVFSPKGDGGAPMPMFDRKTGAVDPMVMAYWREHYDLAHIVESKWSTLGPEWKGRFHLIVGTADTFYLDGAAHRFEAVLDRLGGQPHFTFLPGRTHFDLYKVGDDRNALFDQIGAEMYAVARPGTDWKKTASK